MTETGLVRAFSTLGCPELDLAQVGDLAAAHGIGQVELRALTGSVDLAAQFALQHASPAHLAAAARAFPVKIIAVGSSLRLMGSTAGGRDTFLRLVPWAAALGAPYMRVFDGGATADQAEMDDADDTLRWWDGKRAEHGWPTEIMIETHDALAHPERLQRFVDRHPGRKILWDTHHTWRVGGERPARTWERVRACAVHLHVKDSRTDDSAVGYAYVPPGHGEFPFDELLDVLKADRFAGPISLEWERQWHPALAPLHEVLPDYVSLLS